MKRKFENSKEVYKYLVNKYGKIHNQSFGDDLILTNRIKEDHELEQLEMMKKRINSSISIKKVSSSVSINPMTLIPTLLTLFVTIMIAFSTISSNFMMSTLTNSININKENITQEKLKDLLNSLDYTGIFDIIIGSFLFLFFVISLLMIAVDFSLIKNTTKLYKCSILIEEAIEMKKKYGK